MIIMTIVNAKVVSFLASFLMLDALFPSGKEMHHLTEMNSDLADVLDQRKNGKKTNRSSANKYVPSRNRSYEVRGSKTRNDAIFHQLVYISVWNRTTLKTL